MLADVNLAALLGSEVQQACPLAQKSQLYVRLPAMDQQQQQDAQQLLLRIPAYAVKGVLDDSNSSAAATAADVGAADDGAGASNSSSVEEASGQGADAAAEVISRRLMQQQRRKARRLRCIARAASWSGCGFKLAPAPDAAAVFTYGSPGSVQPQRRQGEQQLAHSSSYSQLMYVYDLLFPASAAVTANAACKKQRLFELTWAAGLHNDDDSAAAALRLQQQQPYFTATRYVTGSGNMHGGMVLQLQRTQESAAAAGGGGNVSVCIFQVVPWQMRLWLHTLQLLIDGQVSCSYHQLVCNH